MFTILLSIFKQSNPVYKVESGNFFRDYFDIQDKPKIPALFLDDKSAVAVQNKQGGKRILKSGFNFINRSEEIVHTFKIEASHFYMGPVYSSNPYSSNRNPNRSGQSHTHNLRLNQTLAASKEGTRAAAAISVFYNLSAISDEDKQDEILLGLSNYFSEKRVVGFLEKEIENEMIIYISKNWKQFANSHSNREIANIGISTPTVLNSNLLGININSKKNFLRDNKSINYENSFSIDLIKAMRVRVFIHKIWINNHD